MQKQMAPLGTALLLLTFPNPILYTIDSCYQRGSYER